MTRRPSSPLFNARYCGNTNTLEVHDLDNEQTQCQINEIIAAGHAKAFHSLQEAIAAGYDRCAYCLGGSLR
jgi:hypothetical protein